MLCLKYNVGDPPPIPILFDVVVTTPDVFKVPPTFNLNVTVSETPTTTLPKIFTDPCMFVVPFISKIQFATGVVPHTGSPIHKTLSIRLYFDYM